MTLFLKVNIIFSDVYSKQKQIMLLNTFAIVTSVRLALFCTEVVSLKYQEFKIIFFPSYVCRYMIHYLHQCAMFMNALNFEVSDFKIYREEGQRDKLFF